MAETKKLIKKVKKMDLGNPVITTLVGLVVFYIGLKMFSIVSIAPKAVPSSLT